MKICLVSGSTQNSGQTLRVTAALQKMLQEKDVGTTLIDLNEEYFSNRLNEIWENSDGNGDVFNLINEKFATADGFIFATPEWGGMATPALKNLFVSCKGLAHKPAMIVSVSASSNGSYPVAELRMSSYKNTKVVYTPDHLIVRDVADAFDGSDSEYNSYITKRADYSLDVLIEYAKAMAPIREASWIEVEDYAFGM